MESPIPVWKSSLGSAGASGATRALPLACARSATVPGASPRQQHCPGDTGGAGSPAQAPTVIIPINHLCKADNDR